jgi:hypothetical protein
MRFIRRIGRRFCIRQRLGVEGMRPRCFQYRRISRKSRDDLGVNRCTILRFPQMFVMHLTGFSSLEVVYCPAVSLRLHALFLLCPGTQHGQLLGVGNEPHVFKHFDCRKAVAG